jgi:uncharacterized membrane protein YphA (DoxX/SURF4 family)
MKIRLDFFQMPLVQFLCQLFLGAVFIYAGFGNIFHLGDFINSIANYKILPESLIKIIYLAPFSFLVLSFERWTCEFVSYFVFRAANFKCIGFRKKVICLFVL